MSSASQTNNPVIQNLTQFHAEHQDDMPGGAATLLSGLIKSEIAESTETALHFDKANALQHSAGSALSEESKRKRVLQLNNFFEQQKTGFKLTSRKHHYILDIPDSLAEQIKNQAFEQYALGIADETNPDDYQTPEADIGRLLFVSHNWRDKGTLDISREFIAHLEQQLADRATEDLSIQVFCDLSDNNNFKLHKGLHEQQDELCKQAQLCLILWNPGYEKSKACQQELSFFVDEEGQNLANKNAIAMLERGRTKDIKNSKTQKISKRILFNYPHGSEHSLIDFWHDASPGEKYQYVASLVDHIEVAFAETQHAKPKLHKLRNRLIEATDQHVKLGLDQDLCDGEKHQIPEGFQASLSDSNRIEIVPCLGKWANTRVTPSVPRVSVLLGDFGFGKTVTCRLLAQHLSKMYKQNPQTGLLPIYLDLKALLGDLDNNKQQPVEHLLETMLAKTGKDAEFKGQNIIDYLQTQKCLVIFDGFDELGHKLNPAEQQAMYHKLLDIIPALVYTNDSRTPEHKKWQQKLADFPSKLLISCRTHFFNHIRQETSFLAGNERHVIREANIQRFYMAPFKPEAIKNYLIDALGSDVEGSQAYDMLGEIHDLSDLSKHPIMLRLISQQIPFLQEMKARGNTVNSASLYSKMFDSIGERDHAKHIIKLSRKQRLLANLAFDLWLQGKTQLYFDKLEDWFTVYSGNEPLLNRQTSGNVNVFDSMVTDLCNATLLVRDAEDKYRFAHTSYLEFFRALGIFEFIRSAGQRSEERVDQKFDERVDTNVDGNTNAALQQQAFSRFSQLPELNSETLQFIINWWQVCNDEEKQAFDSGFIHLLEKPENQQSKWLGFYIWRFALQSLGHPDISQFPHSIAPDWSHMEFGEDFIAPDTIKAFTISHKDVNTPPSARHLDLSQANFEASYFFNQHFLNLNLHQASFSDSRIYQSQFTQVLAHESLFNNAILHHTRPPAPLNPQSLQVSGQYSQKLDVINGHSGSISALCYSHDDKLLATAGADAIISIWDIAHSTAAPRKLHSLKGHQNSIWTLAFAHDSTLLASAGGDGTIRLWDITKTTDENQHQTPACLYKLKGHERAIYTLAFAHDSTLLASAGNDRTIRLWDTKKTTWGNQQNKPTCLYELKGHENEINALAFAHNSALLASADDDGSIRLWDTTKTIGGNQQNKPACLYELKGHQNSIHTLAFAHNSSLIASAGDDSTIRLWDTTKTTGGNQQNKPVCLHVLKGHQGTILTLGFAHNSTLLASAGHDSTIRLWNITKTTGGNLQNKPACLYELKGHKDWVTSLAFSPDSTLLASADYDRTIRLWDTAKTIGGNQQNKPACLYELKGHQNSILTLAFAQNSSLLASAGRGSTIRLWDTTKTTGGNLQNKPTCLYELKGNQDTILSLAFAHNSTLLASAGWDSTIRLWDTTKTTGGNLQNTPACLHELKGHQFRIRTLAFAHNSTLLASAGDDGTIRLWDTTKTTGGNLQNKPACLYVLKGHEYEICTLAFAHTSTLLASASLDSTIRLWDIKKTTDGNQQSKPACLYELKGHQNEINTLAFAHDNTLLASTGWDSTIRLWDTTKITGGNLQTKPACLYELKGHQNEISTLAFAHKSKLLASAGGDSTIRLWECANSSKQPDCLAVLQGAEFTIRALQFSADDQYLYSSSSDEILVWDLLSFQCIQVIRQLPDGYMVFATESEGEQIIYKELLEAQGDAWDYLQAIDEQGNALPAACYKDWDKVYRP